MLTKFLVSMLMALLILLALVPTVGAGDYLLGQDGYYHNAGRRYTRTIVSNPGYWRCNVYYPGASYYSYEAVVEQQIYVPPASYSEDEELFKLARLKLKQQHSLELAQALGLSVSYPGQGTIPSGALPGQGYTISASGQTTTTYGASATTAFGYGPYRFGDYVGLSPADIITLFQMGNQQVLGSKDSFDKGSAGFQQLLTQAGQNQARLAELQAQRDLEVARGRTAIGILNALQSPSGVSTTGFNITISPQAGIKTDSSKVPADVKAAVYRGWQASAQKCASCHTGDQAKQNGGFDVSKYFEITPEQKEVVLARLTTDDLKRRMPRTKDGAAGEALSPAEIKLWLMASPQDASAPPPVPVPPLPTPMPPAKP